MKKLIFIIMLFSFYSCELELEHANPLDNLMITTGSVQEVSTFSCKIQGTITTNEFNGVDNYGHCWSLQNNPTINDASTSFGSYKGEMSFISNINNLEVNTSYYVRAYAVANDTILYAENINIETEWAGDVPLVQTGGANFITTSSATIQGEIVEQGMSSVTKYGLCWSTNTNPNINDNPIEQSGGGNITDFSENITNLSPNTTYYYKAYAENNQGLSYGPEKYFATTNGEPSVTTGGISNVSTTSITLEGEITGEGEATITEHGHCWSTSPNPNINNSTPSTNGNGTVGAFTSDVESLIANTTYYYKAYATNSFNTTYGEEEEFTTTDGLPKVTIGVHSNITATTADLQGEITEIGGAPITQHGFCWSKTMIYPTVYDSESSTLGANTTGTFTESLTGLSPDTNYYYRAYAENTFGLVYSDGNSGIFTTDGSTYIQTYNCESFAGVFSSECIYWDFSQYVYAPWDINPSGGYIGGCFNIHDGGLGGWVEYAWSSNYSGYMELWFYTGNNSSWVPAFLINNIAQTSPTIIGGSTGTWTKIRTGTIPSGSHNIRFEWWQQGQHYNQKIDEVEIWEYQ